jgi:general secretion pathway protein F
MPVFRFRATTPGGELSEGEVTAPSEREVIAQLQAAGLIPLRVSAAGGWSGWRQGRGQPGAREIQVFTQELASLLRAGLPLERALQMVLDLATHPGLAERVGRVLDGVRRGQALSDALEAQTGMVSRFYVSMIRAGETGGALPEVLDRLSEYLQRSRELRDTVVSALIYPAILLVVALVSVFVLMAFVVPQFTQLFEDAGKALPLLTQIVVGSAEFLRGYGWALLIVAVLAGFWLRRRLADPVHRLRWDRLLLRVSLLGELVRKLEAARFSRTLGTLLRNGVPLLAALSITRETLTNRALAEGLDAAVAGLKEGRGMSEPLLAADLFPRLGVQMMRVGEETGRLDAMLMEVAEVYDREVRTAIQRLLALLEPLLIVSLGLIIAVIILSILMAIVSVNELAF